MGLRIGSIVLTPEGLLLAGALCVFWWASYGRVREALELKRRSTLALLAWVSLCGVAGASLYGIPGTLAALNRMDSLPVRNALAFGSFGGYWGVLIGGILAARAMRCRVLPLLDALSPGILLGGTVARSAGIFAATGPGALLSTGAFALWSVCDMTAHVVPFAVLVVLERRLRTRPGLALAIFLGGYGVLRFGLEFFRTDFILYAPVTWGHAMSAVQTAAGLLLLAHVRKSAIKSRQTSA